MGKYSCYFVSYNGKTSFPNEKVMLITDLFLKNNDS